MPGVATVMLLPISAGRVAYVSAEATKAAVRCAMWWRLAPTTFTTVSESVRLVIVAAATEMQVATYVLRVGIPAFD